MVTTTPKPAPTEQDGRERGLYQKFIVERTDGKSASGEKHDGCQYLVLDLTHDPLAYDAARTYAKSAMKAGYTKMAHDLIVLVNRLEPDKDARCPECHRTPITCLCDTELGSKETD